MPRTPDRFPGEREDEGLILIDNAEGDPTVSGGMRLVGDRIRMRDSLGLYTSRPVYVSTSNPTVNDDDSDGFSPGVLWLNSTTGQTFILQDASVGAAVWVDFTGLTENEHEALDTLVHDIAETSYDEMTYSGNRLTNQTTWETASKLKKIREQQITYSGGRVTQIINIQYDAAGVENTRTTEVYSYSGNKVTDVTRTQVP